MSLTPFQRAKAGAIAAVGAPLLGVIAEHFGARWTLVGGGLLTIGGSLLAAALYARHEGVVLTPHLRPRPGLGIAVRPVEQTVTEGAVAA